MVLFKIYVAKSEQFIVITSCKKKCKKIAFLALLSQQWVTGYAKALTLVYNHVNVANKRPLQYRITR